MNTGNLDPTISDNGAHWFSILVLMTIAIVFVTAEIIPVGMLNEISLSFHQPVGRVGLIVTGYAWAVAISAVVITSWLSAQERRKLLLIVTFLFSFANLLVALAPSLTFLFIARVIGAFSHGVFWSIVGPLCVRLAGKTSKARATAVVFGGIAIATVVMVPIGTLLSQLLSWRFVFASISGLSFLLALALAWGFKKMPGKAHDYLRQLPLLLQYPLLRRLFPATALALMGHFCAFTYIAVLLERDIGIDHSYLALYLFLFGIAGVVGNILVSYIKDSKLNATCFWVILCMALVIILCVRLPLYSFYTAAMLVSIWGASICILTVTLQSLILTVPEKIVDAASTVHVSMFNAGIGSGALIGGLIVDYFPLNAVAWVGGVALLISAGIVAWPNKRRMSKSRVDQCQN